MLKAMSATMNPKSLDSCWDPVVGIHRTRPGISPPHSSEGIPSAHDKSPTHTRPLSLLPLTATFTHRECLCVCVFMCHGQQPLTLYSTLTQREITEKRRNGKSKKKKKKKGRVMGAPEHTCVKRLCHIWDELIYGRFLCAKGHNPLPTLSSLSTSSSPRHSSLIALLFQGRGKKKKHLVLLSAQVEAEFCLLIKWLASI